MGIKRIMAILFQRRADFYTTEGHIRSGADKPRRYIHPRWRWPWSIECHRYLKGQVKEVKDG